MRNIEQTARRLAADQGARRADRDRRLRHRLLLARPPPALPRRRAEDRPLVHLRAEPQQARARRCIHTPRATRQGALDRDLRRGHRAAARARRCSETRTATAGRASCSPARSTQPRPRPSSSDRAQRSQPATPPAPTRESCCRRGPGSTASPRPTSTRSPYRRGSPRRHGAPRSQAVDSLFCGQLHASATAMMSSKPSSGMPESPVFGLRGAFVMLRSAVKLWVKAIQRQDHTPVIRSTRP